MGISFALLTQSTTPVIGWLAQLFGIIMNAIYNFLSFIGIENVGLCIIIFTILINICLLPLTISQLKQTKITSYIQPEVKKIQSKYRGKNDQASQQKMQAEVQEVYTKYGVSMFGGCLPLLIQLPILYGLYEVIKNIPAYVASIKEVYMSIVTPMMGQANFTSLFGGVIESTSYSMDSYAEIAGTAAGNNWLVDVLSSFTTQWNDLISAFPNLADTISANLEKINTFNNFLGLNLVTTPSTKIFSAMLLIPVLAGVTQFLSIKITSGLNSQAGGGDAMAAGGMGKTMTYTMPLISVFFCFAVPVGLGLYWIASAVVRTVITLIVGRGMKDVDAAVLIEQNAEKAEKKRKKNLDRQKSAAQRASELSSASMTGMTRRDRINAGFARVAAQDKNVSGVSEELNGAATYTDSSVYKIEAEKAAKAVEDPKKAKRLRKEQSAAPSLAAKANMVRDYNEAHGISGNVDTESGYRRKKKKK